MTVSIAIRCDHEKCTAKIIAPRGLTHISAVRRMVRAQFGWTTRRDGRHTVDRCPEHS